LREQLQKHISPNIAKPDSNNQNGILLPDKGPIPDGRTKLATLPTVMRVTFRVEAEPFRLTELGARKQEDCCGAPLQLNATI